MADDTTATTTTTDATTATTGTTDARSDSTTSSDTGQPEVPPEVKRALAKANKEAETLRLKLKEIEDRDLSEQQKLEKRATEAEARAVRLELDNLRFEVAADKGLTPKQARRLVGNTKEELEADADELLADFKATTGGRVTYDGGTRTTTSAPGDMNTLIRKAAGRG